MKKLLLKKIFLSVLFLYFSVMSFPAFSEETEGIIAREKFSTDVMRMLNDIKFKELDELAGKIRGTENRFPEGAFKISSYYEGLTPRGPNVQKAAGKTGKTNWNSGKYVILLL